MKIYNLFVLVVLSSFVLVGCQTPPKKEVEMKPPPLPPLQEVVPIKIVVNFSDVFFDYNMYSLSAGAKQALKDNANGLKRDPDLMVTLAGHCDERGTNEYNISLGHKRANEVKRYLKGLGIDSSRVRAISYGEEKGVCSSSNESCWQKNRRVEFIKN